LRFHQLHFILFHRPHMIIYIETYDKILVPILTKISENERWMKMIIRLVLERFVQILQIIIFTWFKFNKCLFHPWKPINVCLTHWTWFLKVCLVVSFNMDRSYKSKHSNSKINFIITGWFSFITLLTIIESKYRDIMIFHVHRTSLIFLFSTATPMYWVAELQSQLPYIFFATQNKYLIYFESLFFFRKNTMLKLTKLQSTYTMLIMLIILMF